MNLRCWSLIAAGLLSQASAFAAAPPPPVAQATNPYAFLNWGDSPEAYLLTNAERAEWSHALSEPAAQAFINSYWEKHGPAWRKEVLARIAAADKYFPLADKKGSQTQRGRVFIILGAPNRQQTNRDDVASAQTSPGARNSIDQRAVVSTVWTYKSDRLPKALGVPELVVKFQTDVQRGYETIENPGLVEPYLTRAADYIGQQSLAAASKTPAPRAPQPAPASAAPVALSPSDEVLWAATDPKGAFVSGDTFVSPTDKTFYAVDFYLPRAALANAAPVSVAAAIKDAAGKQVVSVRNPAKVATYDDRGDRFVDASFELPPGHYTGVFALTSADGTVLAANKREFDVRPIDAPGVSSLFMTSHIDTLEKQEALDPFTFVAMKYAIKGDHQFKSSDKIGYFIVLANPTLAPDPSFMLKMKLTKDGKSFGSTPAEPANLTQTSAHTYLVATQFDSGTFPPGHYTLQVTLRDMRADKASDLYLKGYVSNTEFDVVP